MSAIVAPENLPLQRLYHWERTAPNRVAFTQPEGPGRVVDYTWGQVQYQVRRVAAWLKKQGIRPGDRVALLSKNTAHWIMTDYAIWMVGAVSVPLYPTLAPGTIRQILTHSESKLLFVGKLDGWLDMKPGIPEGLPCVHHPLADADAKASYPGWDEIVAQTAPLLGEPVRPGQDLSTIMYTSGTTGAPKGVMHSFANFISAISATLERLPLSQNTRMLSYLPLSHVVERAFVEHAQLVTGMHVFFAESLETFTADLQRARPTIFFSVPRLWVKFQQGILQKVPQRKLNLLLSIPILSALVKRRILRGLGLEQCIFAAGGAAPMPLDLLRWYSRLGLPIAEGYGMTENIGATHIATGDEQNYGTVGRPYGMVWSRISPDDGEIQVRCPWTMLGYYKQAEETAAVLTKDGWLKTGDRGRVDVQGRLRITGRVKDLFKTSKGKYVAPAAIEDKLVMHPAIEACCVTGVGLGQPRALLMLNSEASAHARNGGRIELESSFTEYMRDINRNLDPHEQLDCLVVTPEPWTVDNDLITPTFKVKRIHVEEKYSENYEQWVDARKAVVWAS
jgi:long-chain acyl-CoA synthetase